MLPMVDVDGESHFREKVQYNVQEKACMLCVLYC